jgi:hypothetical protein
MIRVRYMTTTNRPPHRVACRVVGDKRPWTEFAGVYVDRQWVFDLPDGQDQLVLALDGQVEGTQFAPAPVVELDDGGAGLGEMNTAPIGVDDGRLQQLWFAEGANPTQRWDLLIVGHGMAGGVLHTALVRNLATKSNPARSLQVLGLEAGSLLFTGHAGNQPAVRPPGEGTFPITMWNTLEDFGTYPFTNDADPQWKGKEVFALGGRSLYWGAVCPRIDEAELAKWPNAVHDALTDGSGWYLAAEQLLGVGHPRADDVARDGLQLLGALLPDRTNTMAPVALRREKPTSWRIPGSLFSTAEQLLEERLSRRIGDGYGPPFLHLGEIAVRVEPDQGGWAVHGVDLRDGTPTVRYARRVVLCCGTVESARLLAASPRVKLNATAGAGLTEHLMGWVHFEIPPGSPFCRADTSAKLLSTPGRSGEEWNLLLDLGSDLNLGYTDAASWARSATSDGAVAGQLVFFGRADPGDGSVAFGPDPWLALNLPENEGLPEATLQPGMRGAIPDRWNTLARKIIAGLSARRLKGEQDQDGENKAGWPALKVGDMGYVAHEVGTLRMSEKDQKGVVDADLQVKGNEGLFVCDNSVFPTSPAANPSLTLAALALRLADHIRELPW